MNVTGHFRASKCKRHLDIVLGKMLQPNASTELDKYIPYVRAANVHWGNVDWSDLKEMWFSPTDLKKYTLEDGDLVVLEGGDVGRCAILQDTPNELGFQNSIHRVRARDGTDIRFVYYWMAHLKSFGYLDLVCSKATLAHFTGEKFAEAPFPVVDLATQRQIADFLDRETARIDLLIEKREKFAALVAEARDSLVAKMICGEGSEQLDTASHDWIEARPKHWKSERAKVHFRERTEKSVDGSEELLTVSHITGVTTRAEKEVNMFLAESNEGYKIVHPGDIVINTMWGWMGAMGASSNHGIISPSYGVYRPISDEFEREYLDLMLRSKPFVAEVTRRSKGIHSSRLRIYPDAFLDMQLPVPPRNEQVAILSEFHRRTERENALLAKNELASALLNEYRSSMITAAVTGQIDVTTYAKSGTLDRQFGSIQEEMEA